MAGTVAIFVERLDGFDPFEAKALNERLVAEGGGLEVYALVWPNYPPEIPRPQDNRAQFATWRAASGVPLWAWLNASSDQDSDVSTLQALDAQLTPSGWLLDIEGEWTKGAKLSVLAEGCAALNRPRRASLAGASASHSSIDFRALDLAGFEVDWQAYLDTLEGPPPATAVQELYRSNFVVQGWEYRHRLGDVYGWGKVSSIAAEKGYATFDSFKRPGTPDAVFSVAERQWGATVIDGKLTRDGREVGLLMGRCAYPRIRVTLDLTRGAADKRSLSAWTELAASARVPGSKVRPASVYCASEAVRDDVVLAIARGSG